MSILALAIDRIDGYRSAHGDAAANDVLAKVARAVRRLAANIGIVAASYRNGMIVLVAPELTPTRPESSARRCTAPSRNCACRTPNRSCPTM
jgi:hypothetical protein